MTQTRQLNIGVLIYGCGHHHAAWRMSNSSVERIGDISYYQSLAQIAERGLFDAIFLQIINLFQHNHQVICPHFGLTLWSI